MQHELRLKLELLQFLDIFVPFGSTTWDLAMPC